MKKGGWALKSEKKIELCLHKILQERNMKESELAKLTGLYPSYINSITHNEHPHINLKKLAIIATVLNIKDISKLINFTKD